MTLAMWKCFAVMAVVIPLCLADTQLEFTTTPVVITEGITKSVTMHCGINANSKRAPSYSPDAIATVLYLSIANPAGQTVATVHGDQAQVLINKGGVTATGSLTGRVHLDLTFTAPADLDLGVYKCELTGYTAAHRNVRLQNSVNVKSTNPMIADVIKSFKNDMRKQQEEIDKIKACEAVRVAFTARHETKCVRLNGCYKQYNENEQVQYKDVVTNINGDYDARTSTFTCTEPGIYQFDVHVRSYPKYDSQFRLVHNGRRLTEASTNESGSTTALVKLAKGDTVKVVAALNSPMSEGGENSHRRGNTFSGFLVSSDKCLH